MPLFTFYLCAGDGSASSFEAFELGGDDYAAGRALKLLGEHPSCSYVAVWENDRPLFEKHREPGQVRRLDLSDSAGERA